MSFYLTRLEAMREQHQIMMAAAAAAGRNAAHAPRAWPPPYPQHHHQQQHAALLPRPEHHHHHPPVPPPPLHATGSSSRVVDTWRGAGTGSVARRDRDDGDGAPVRAGGGSLGVGVGVAGSATSGAATAREETGSGGGEEVRNKRPLALAVAPTTTPRPRSPPPKRRAVAVPAAARRLFPPGCGRDDALPLASAADDGGASWPVAARGDGGSGAPHKSAPPPPRRRPALAAGAKVDGVLFEATSSPSAAAAAAVSSALNKVSASDGAAGVTTDGGGHYCQGERLVNSSESAAVAGPGNGKLFKSKEGFVPSIRFMPKPTTVSASRRFPPGCRRLGAPLLAGDGTTNQEVCLPSPEEVVPAERDDKEFVARPGIGTADGAAQNRGSQDGTIPEVHESQVSSSVVHDTCSGHQRIGNRWHCEEMSSSAVPSSSANVTNKSGGNVAAAESLAQGLFRGHKNESVSECGALNNTSSDDFAAAATMSAEVAVMRKKVMHTARKSVRPPKLIQKSLLKTQRRPFTMAIERVPELGWSVNMDDIEDTGGVFTKDHRATTQDPPISANKSSWTNGKEPAYFGPKKRVSKKKLNKRRFTVKSRAHPTMKVASGCALGSTEKLKDDEIFKALDAHETKFEYGSRCADPRSKVRLICTRFESICRAIVQAAGHRSMKVRRVDLAADKLIRKLPGFTKQGPVVGSVPGVEVGDEFLYRVQLALVGLHRPFQGGIDSTRHESGVRIAISVVASGGYPDELSSCSGELVYTGSGKKDNGDQKLEHGNLALKNCIGMQTPVRVIHGFKDQNREEDSHSRAREISTFTYDGLYHVVECWREGSPGSKVFKYKLRRIPGQPQLSLHRAKSPW